MLHLISSGGLYGAEAVILQLCAELKTAGHSPSLGVFFHGSSDPPLYTVAKEAGLDVHAVPCGGQLDRRAVHAIRRHAEHTQSEVVHAHGYKADLYTRLAFRKRCRPALVSTCHNWIDSDLTVRVYGMLDRWALQSFDEVVAVSDHVAVQLTQAGVSPSRVSVIRNGVSTGPLKALRGSQKPDANKLIAGLVGRLSPEKGIDLLLHAMARLRPEFPHLALVLAGDGPERTALESLTNQLGLREAVTFSGAIREMDALYSSLDLLVLASRTEGLPMVLLEGMASGLPVVATAVGEVPRVVAQGETGLVVPPGDVAALAEAMAELLRSPELRNRFGRAGQQRVEECFSAAKMTHDYLGIYHRALRRLVRTASFAESSRGGEL